MAFLAALASWQDLQAQRQEVAKQVSREDVMAVIAMAQEAELRTRLHLLGYELRRSPVRDPKHPAYGGYMIVDARQHVVVAGYEPFAFSLDLDGVADWLRAFQIQ